MEHDLFLSHNSADKPYVEELAHQLLEHGVRPWFDKWDIRVGMPTLKQLSDALEEIPVILVCIGAHGFGPVHDAEMNVALDRAMRRQDRKVVPVLLPGAPPKVEIELPAFLGRYPCVNLRKLSAERVKELVDDLQGRQSARSRRRVIGECPYRGLEAFEEEHARFFFGRDKEVERLLERLRQADQARRFLLVTGASGTGKSSLLRAGLVPAVRTGQLDGSYGWQIMSMVPTARPCHELAIQLTLMQLSGRREGLAEQGEYRSSLDTLDQIEKELLERQDALSNYVDLALTGLRGNRRLLLVVDSFERLFPASLGEVQAKETRERDAFIANLIHAVRVSGGRVHVVIGLRIDFLGKCLNYPHLKGLLEPCLHVVEHMDAKGVREAIVRPAHLLGVRFSDGLVEALLEDIRHQPGDLPLLQFALERLWSQAEDQQLTSEAYGRIGRLRGAVAGHANRLLTQDMNERERGIAFALLGRLVQLGERSDTDTRRTDTRAELESIHPEIAPKVLEQLIQARLLTVHDEGARVHLEASIGGEARIELAHEILIREWDMLKQWINDHRDSLRQQEALRRAVTLWGDGGDSQVEELWQGKRLARVFDLQGKGVVAFSGREQRFLEACKNQEQQELQRQERVAEEQRQAEKRRAEEEVLRQVRLAEEDRQAQQRLLEEETRRKQEKLRREQAVRRTEMSALAVSISVMLIPLFFFSPKKPLPDSLFESGSSSQRRAKEALSGIVKRRSLSLEEKIFLRQTICKQGVDELDGPPETASVHLTKCLETQQKQLKEMELDQHKTQMLIDTTETLLLLAYANRSKRDLSPGSWLRQAQGMLGTYGIEFSAASPERFVELQYGAQVLEALFENDNKQIEYPALPTPRPDLKR
jgi:hypothetical protein